jgi:hypothetical protein
VNEQVRMSTGIVVEAAPRPLPMLRKFLGLSPHPLHKIPIEVSPQLAERRRIEPTVVGLPALQYRIEHPRKIRQRFLVLELDVPTANLPIDLLFRGAADRRQEVRMQLPLLIHAPSWTECVTEKGDADLGIVFAAMDILAINDARFVGMDFQPALPETR